MFRGCYFEFAGRSSEPFNLMLFYLKNDTDNFNSGGFFELKTEAIPYSNEQFLYGKDYSGNPLEFEVEIVTPEGNIPPTQMLEIKNWLFGQDGWKDLAITDETQTYHLKCVLVPSEDITDCNGYRGVRCTVHNASPFWYGDEKEIVISHSDLTSNYYTLNGNLYYAFNIYVPYNDYVDCDIYPTLEINIDKSDASLGDPTTLHLATTEASSVTDALSVTDGKWNYADVTKLICDISYIGHGQTDSKDVITVDTKYVILKSQNFPNQSITFNTTAANSTKPTPFFKLNYGDNICRIRYAPVYSSITVKFLPLYRMGAF